MDVERGIENLSGSYDERTGLLAFDRSVWWSMGMMEGIGTRTQVRFVGKLTCLGIGGAWGPPGSLPGPQTAAEQAKERGDVWGGCFWLQPR